MAQVPPATVALVAPADAEGAPGVERVLTICGCNNNLRQAIVEEGIDSMSKLRRLTDNNIDNMAKRITSLPANRGGTRFGEVHLNNVKALCRWVTTRYSSGLDLNSNEFNETVLDECLDDLEVGNIQAKVEPEKPIDFNPKKWVQWKRSMTNYLSTLPSKNLVPLSYIIRKVIDPAAIALLDREQQQVYNVQLTGPKYRADRMTVYQIYKSKLIDTDAWVWMKPYDTTKNGRDAHFALCAHYDGPGETQKRIAEARHMLSTAHYKAEHIFNFEKFVTRLQEAYQILEDNGEPRLETEKVREMCDKIQCDKMEIRSAVVTVRTNIDPTGQFYRDDYTRASNYLSEVVGMCFPADTSNKTSQARRIRNVSETSTQGRGRGRGPGRGRGRFQGRGGRGGRSNGQKRKQMVNGVDITDLTRYYTGEELDKLPAHVKSMIWEAKKRQRGQNDNHGGQDHHRIQATNSQPRAQSRNEPSPIIANPQGNEVNDNATEVSAISGASNMNNGRRFGSGAYGENNSQTTTPYKNR